MNRVDGDCCVRRKINNYFNKMYYKIDSLI